MNTDIQSIIQAKDAERRRLRELPWLEKLEILDKLRDRHLLLRQTQPVDPASANASRFPSFRS